MDCINLQEQFGQRYRITFDAAYNPRHCPKDKLDPVMMQIPCERGVIYPHGGTRLAVEVDGRAVTAGKLWSSDACTLHQDGDHQKTFTFDVSDFQVVAAIVMPRRKRRLTEAQKQAAAARLAKYQFRSEPCSPARSERPVRHASNQS
jgi:hypothetical protein